jgi:hypothetical protein
MSAQGFQPIGKFERWANIGQRAASRSYAMANTSDFVNIPGMSKEVRDRVIAAFDALTNWRDEIETANERCLGKVLDQTSAVARSMGWPDEAIRATRDVLESTSKAQTQLIDQMVDGWKRQLKSPTAPMGIPRGFTAQIPGLSAATPEFNPLAPWTFWLQAAEMWQRAWLPEGSSHRQRSH